jgi:phosphoribosylanthranilate isomerase
MSLIVKICGMREPDNIRQVAELKPDYLGLIFHPASARYVGDLDPQEILAAVPPGIEKVGVFVNDSVEEILILADKWALNTIQLHGPYRVQDAQKLKDAGFRVIKVFSIRQDFDFTETEAFEGHADLFLFDTAGKHPGGNGIAFDWQLLKQYKGKTPFLLSGGIEPADAEAILNIEHLMCAGVDLNSRFELQPGLKNIDLLKPFLAQLILKQ